jgi:hypothetical protein
MAQPCPICSKSLADGMSVVFKDGKLIHARCWPCSPRKGHLGHRELRPSRPGARTPPKPTGIKLACTVGTPWWGIPSAPNAAAPQSRPP